MSMASGLRSLLGRVTTSGAVLTQIDGLRFIAVALVVLFHTESRIFRRFVAGDALVDEDTALIFRFGDIGVQLFFVISGFIVFYPFVKNGVRSVRLVPYYLRRFVRIWPPCAALLAASYVFIRFAHPDLTSTQAFARASDVPLEQSLLASLAFVHGQVFDVLPKLNPVLWSLEIEAYFYLVAPALAFVLAAAFRRLGAAKADGAIGAAMAACIAISIWSYANPNDYKFSLLRFLPYFLLGYMLCRHHHDNRMLVRVSPWLGDVLFVAGLALCISTSTVGVFAVYETAKLAGFYAMFAGALRGRLTRMVLGRPAVYLTGGMCFSIYLVHLPVLQVITGPLMRLFGTGNYALDLLAVGVPALIVVMAVSVVFFLAVEKPCMSFRGFSRSLSAAPAGNAPVRGAP